MPKGPTGRPRGKPPKGGWPPEKLAAAAARLNPRKRVPAGPVIPENAIFADPSPDRPHFPDAGPTLEPHIRPPGIPEDLVRMAHPEGHLITGPAIYPAPEQPGVAYVPLTLIPQMEAHGFRIEH